MKTPLTMLAVAVAVAVALTGAACHDDRQVGAPPAAAAKPAAAFGVPFADPDGRYTARFPAAPHVEHNVAQGEMGAVASTVARLPLDVGIFTTMTVTFPAPGDTEINLEALLRVARDQVLVEVKGHASNEARVDKPGLIGLAFDYTGTVEDDAVAGHAIVYVAADPATARIVSVFAEPKLLDEKAAQAFLAAFVPATPAGSLDSDKMPRAR